MTDDELIEWVTDRVNHMRHSAGNSELTKSEVSALMGLIEKIVGTFQASESPERQSPK